MYTAKDISISVGLILALLTNCRGPEEADLSPGVSWQLAQQRSRALSDIQIRVAFTIPAELETPVEGEITFDLEVNHTRLPLVLDFRESPDKVHQARVGDQVVAHRFENGHIIIPRRYLKAGQNRVSVDFIAGETSLNRRAELLYTLFVPDRASTVFPCFDQPDMKARYRLILQVPRGWEAVANGPVAERQESGDHTTFIFNPTEPLSTYLFAFAAGKFSIETALRGDREFRMYHRETDAEKVQRNREAIFDLHHQALTWLEDYTGIDYPFSKFDFVLIPAFQYGGMEHPGAILYRDSRLLLDASATQNQILGRASIIAHETSHMWFGNLVTMNWFDDVWTKEVFANFMAARIVNPSFPEIDHELRFLLAHYPAAYGVDRTAGANPIRQQLDNLRDAGALYGAIIYQKAPIVMRQLERIVGAEIFRDGLQKYLQSFAYGNATWPDLIDILDQGTPEDLRFWGHVWVEEPGRPTVTVRLETGGAGADRRLIVRQADPRGRGLIWNQRLGVVLGYGDQVRRVDVPLSAEESHQSAPPQTPDYILAGGDGVGYGYFVLDSLSREYLLRNLPALPTPLLRGSAWITLWDDLLEGHVPVEPFVQLALRSLEQETDELNIQRVLSYLSDAYWHYLPTHRREALAPAVENQLWRLLNRADTSSLKAAMFNSYRSIALTDSALQTLRCIWGKEQEIEGLILSERDLSTLALQLAVREVPGWEAILEQQLARITNPDRQKRFAFVVPFLSADQAARDSLFEGLKDPRNRENEPWVTEALRYLHHPLRAAASAKYIRPSLELLEEIQRTGDVFFPKQWLDATLGGHNSREAADIVQSFLDEFPRYPARLKGKILQSADPLFRAAAILEHGS